MIALIDVRNRFWIWIYSLRWPLIDLEWIHSVWTVASLNMLFKKIIIFMQQDAELANREHAFWLGLLFTYRMTYWLLIKKHYWSNFSLLSSLVDFNRLILVKILSEIPWAKLNSVIHKNKFGWHLFKRSIDGSNKLII